MVATAAMAPRVVASGSHALPRTKRMALARTTHPARAARLSTRTNVGQLQLKVCDLRCFVRMPIDASILR